MSSYAPSTLIETNDFKVVGSIVNNKLDPVSLGLVPKTQIMNSAYLELVAQCNRWVSKVAGTPAAPGELPYITMGVIVSPFIYNQALYNMRVIGRYVAAHVPTWSAKNSLLYRVSTKPITEAWILLGFNTTDVLDELRVLGDSFALPPADEIDTNMAVRLPAVNDVVAAGLDALKKKTPAQTPWLLIAAAAGILWYAGQK